MFVKEITTYSIEDLRDLTTVEIFGIISIEALANPSLRDCLFSLVRQNNTVCNPSDCSIRVYNDYYRVDFIPLHSDGMKIMFASINSDGNPLYFLDDNGVQNRMMSYVWDIDMIQDYLEHWVENEEE
ncbi:MAG TPA: hypothetical protein DCW90_17910 [Lachnospiraceae bacterium]|nr:hypothetical protein [Lachnospiraceae bacterium]